MSADRPTDSEAAKGDTPDRCLLDRFIWHRDDVAFRELVLRHGNLVMGVCRRVLRHEYDADDAFQATFLVLARGARRIRNRHSIAAWLYGTAYRIARKMRAQRYRRREAPLAGEMCVDGDVLAALAERCDREALDEELTRLPQRYRESLVLHYLHKRTAREIADELGLSVRAVEGRLRRGRNELRYRLARRGVSLAVVASAVETLHTATAAAASTLVDSTVEAGLAYASGNVTSNASGLAVEELRRMSPTGTTTSLMATIVAVALLVGGTGYLELPSTAARELGILHFGVGPHTAKGSDDGGTFVMADAPDAGAQPANPPDEAADAEAGPAEPVADGQPGRIYLAAHLRIPQVDDSDRVLGVIAVDPQTGDWELVRDANASSLRVAADGKTVVMYVLDRVSRQSRLILLDLRSSMHPRSPVVLDPEHETPSRRAATDHTAAALRLQVRRHRGAAPSTWRCLDAWTRALCAKRGDDRLRLAVTRPEAGIEPCASRELVRNTADRMGRIIDHTSGRLPAWVAGYQVRILDGNHHPRTDRRLKELRSMNAAPLPGKTLVVLDPLRMLAIDAFPCEDGHAQERSLLPQVLQTIEADSRGGQLPGRQECPDARGN